MKIGSMVGDILKSLFKKPATIHYPAEKIRAPERYRGQLFWEPEKCTGCQLCIKDCPSNAIELLVIDKVNRRFVMRYDIDKCTYCAQCIESCRLKCLNMDSQQWELASTHKQPFTVYYGKDEDIDLILARDTDHLAPSLE
jgi:formate hydrogenlyase subunit 6/NADH:ubiquinone oxidoreductase subunit I